MRAAPVWYFDFISPFAYLQWPRIEALLGEREVGLRPIVLAAVLAARGQKGPAEIPGKREFTYRHVQWSARRAGLPLRFPPAHPFNPIAALRLCLAADATPHAVAAIFDWIWARGEAGDSIAALAPLAATLGVDPAAIDAERIKLALRANTDAAVAAGVFGVPTLAFDDALFWGADAHDFALAALDDPALLAEPEMQRLATLPMAARRRD
ncbi:MAG: 2-hydroxychromene-2-carboxylate isomerase [Lysobacter sp.]